jgi:hypothetical protein
MSHWSCLSKIFTTSPSLDVTSGTSVRDRERCVNAGKYWQDEDGTRDSEDRARGKGDRGKVKGKGREET